MIQILGLRTYVHEGVEKTKETFYEKHWRAPSIADLFANIQNYLAEIPEDEHYNLYYTASKCLEKKGRKLEAQHVIPIDIDGIDLDRIDEYIEQVVSVLGLRKERTGIVATGNGLQFIIQTPETILDEEYFDEHRVYYKGICNIINTALGMNGLKGSADTSVWSPARLLRLPNTKNDKTKKGLGIKDATLLQSNVEEQNFDLVEKSGIPQVSFDDFVTPDMLMRLPEPDAKAVQEGCDFLKWCKDNQDDVIEPQWYAMLSIVGRLDRELAHEYSKEHSFYNRRMTDLKVEQALANAGPRTCANIESLWDGCSGCKNFKKCTSPITLSGKEHVKTANTGFYRTMQKDGKIVTGKPDYDDLMKWFNQQHDFVSMAQSGILYTFNGTHWEHYSPAQINQFAEDHFEPKPTSSMCNEFRQKLLRNNVVSEEFFHNATTGLINFQNGVYNIQDRTMVDHSPEYPFQYVLPFMFNPNEDAPRFKKFMDDISCKDEEIKTVLLEFMGYTLAGIDASFLQKALILYGGGSNGKSVFLDLLQHLAGKNNFTNVSLGHDINKLENRYALDGKLFNATEETPNNAMMDNTVFKSLVGGGTIQARRLYTDSYSFKNDAKIILACNTLPKNFDNTFGMYRRLLIVPFNARFSDRSVDYDPDILKKLCAESSGIFNIVLEYLYPLLDRKRFTDSKVIGDQVSEYREESGSDVKYWLGEALTEDTSNPDTHISLQELYQCFAEDARAWGFKAGNIRMFGKRLREALPEGAEFKRKTLANGVKSTCLVGYKLLQDPNNGGF